MSILAWVILGLIAGWVASLLMGSGAYGLIGDVPAGILGAVVWGWLGSWWLRIDVTGLDLTSVAVSVVGAVSLILVLRALAPGPWWQAWRNG